MQARFASPRDAVKALLEAFQTRDIERIVACKDFDLDSRVFWEGLGLPVSDRRLAKSREAFESNFRKKLEEGIPDYESANLRIVGEDRPAKQLAVITFEGTDVEGSKFILKIPTLETVGGWIVILHPEYDHL